MLAQVLRRDKWHGMALSASNETDWLVVRRDEWCGMAPTFAAALAVALAVAAAGLKLWPAIVGRGSSSAWHPLLALMVTRTTRTRATVRLAMDRKTRQDFQKPRQTFLAVHSMC